MAQAHHPEKASIKTILFLCLISSAFSLYSPAQAQITPDNTLGAETSRLNQNLLINGALGDKIDGGATRGGNLFHSFRTLGVDGGANLFLINPNGILFGQNARLDVQGSFVGTSPNVIDTKALIANSCISRGTKRQENSFTITGSGALRNSPGGVLISVYTTGDVRSVEPISRTWKKGDPIIEPQGLYRLPNGQLILSRSCSK